MGCISVEGVIWLGRSRGVSAFVYLRGKDGVWACKNLMISEALPLM